jgi:hypothetical protein
VLEDLITREGPATYDSFSPFNGEADEIKRQFNGTLKSKYKQSEFLAYTLYAYKDLNPAMVREVKQYGMLQEVEQSLGNYSTLEDLIIDGVESTKVKEYVINMCVGYKKNNKSPVIANVETYTRTLRNYDGDGDTEEEKVLQVRQDEMISNDAFEETVRELPYIMKSIWSYSKQYKANLFSFIFAYMDIKAKDRKRNYVTVTDFRWYPTFLIDANGNYKRNFVHEDDNKYIIYPNVTKIFINPDAHKAEFGLCVKFMDALSILGIDYRDEDPVEYNNDFINSIICTYLPTNEEYFSEFKDVDIELMVALKPENIFSTSKSNMYINTLSDNKEFDYNKSAFFITERIKLAYRLGEIDDELLEENEDATLALLDRILSAMQGKNITVPRQIVTFEANGLLHFKKEILDLPGEYFGTYKGRTDYRIVLTKYNFVVALEEEYDDVYYLKIDDCFEALKEYETYGISQSEAHWRCLGANN